MIVMIRVSEMNKFVMFAGRNFYITNTNINTLVEKNNRN